MITKFHVENYKALRDVTLDLTPIHVLIGPNDSGKTSVLEALAAFCRSVDYPVENSFVCEWSGLDLVWKHDCKRAIRLAASIESVETSRKLFEYAFVAKFAESQRSINVVEELSNLGEPNAWQQLRYVGNCTMVQKHARKGDGPSELRRAFREIYHSLSPVHWYRWSAANLAMPVRIESGFSDAPIHSSGLGLVGTLDKLSGTQRERLARIEESFTNIFKDVESVVLDRKSNSGGNRNTHSPPNVAVHDCKALFFRMKDGKHEIPASQMSDGAMLTLAYLTVLSIENPPRLLLVEEPETGIHPKRLVKVLDLLRDMFQGQARTQVILTTHSPYVLDHFEPDEVSVCRKQKDGSVAITPLSKSNVVKQQRSVFTLGEIWTAEGDEALGATSDESEDATE